MDHPQRSVLNAEVHARPPAALHAPLRFAYVALLCDADERVRSWEHLQTLLDAEGIDLHADTSNHLRFDLRGMELTWERHTEYIRYTLVERSDVQGLGIGSPLDLLPEDWVANLPGAPLVAARGVALAKPKGELDFDALSKESFSGNPLIGSKIGGGGFVFTDFRIDDGGFSRFVIFDEDLSPRQAGRYLQRILEVETYFMLALLALPVAQQLRPFISEAEDELAQITRILAQSSESDEQPLLERLTQLDAAIEEMSARNHYRFGAAAAYYDLVQARIGELREERLRGLQTFQEFTERRLAPAMQTCQSVASRQEGLSKRVARATQLLSTRVGLARERQNQALLHSMDRRAALQLRLQATVEGLSVAAITYYIVGLVGYGARGLAGAGVGVAPDLAMAVSIVPVAGLVFLAVRKARRSIGQDPR